MTKILLIHQKQIQHYRITIYNYLSSYLKKQGFELYIVAEGIEAGSPFNVEFKYDCIAQNYLNLKHYILDKKAQIVILFVNLKHLYLFPLLFFLKLSGIKSVYWGHGLDLQKKHSVKNIAYHLEHNLVDAIILYADFLRNYVNPKHHNKIFIANNTLNLSGCDGYNKRNISILSKFNITTRQNIICMGRMHKRKRIHDLIKAFRLLNRNDVGLVLAGPDSDGILKKIELERVYKTGPLYGKDADVLLSSCDIFCLPGAVGLSIVDAFRCGLPFITEEVDHGPEISYLKHGINGFIVSKGDVSALAEKIKYLLDNDALRRKFSHKAIEIIKTEGHIDRLCEGFLEALQYVSM